jgi:hypothetical protein
MRGEEGRGADEIEETENGKILYWGIRLSSWWIWNL